MIQQVSSQPRCATITKFPKRMKRGPKVRKGPLASVETLYPPREPESETKTQSREMIRLVKLLQQKMDHEERASEERFIRRQQGVRCTAEYYAEGTSFGSATDHKGTGPRAYEWAKDAVAGSAVLRFNARDDALELAISTLNQIAHLLRFGGISVGRAHALPGFDEGQLRDYEYSCFSDLGETMVRLRAFGARA